MTKTIARNPRATRRSAHLISLLLGSTAVVGLAAISARADETWTGAINNSWHISGNWSGNAVPSSADNVFIDTMATFPTVVVGNNGSANDVSVGINNTGWLDVTGAGSALGVHSIALGLNAGATGTLTVESGATLTSTAGLTVGVGGGIGTVTVQTGGVLNTGATTTTTVSGASGTMVLLDGTGSSWNAGSITVGDVGTGTVTIQNSATLQVTADLTVAGTNAYSGPLTDTLAIASGGTVTVGGSVTVGNNPNIVAAMTIDGAGSSLQDSGGLLIGNNGAGQVKITGGGSASAVGINIGGFSAAPSTLTVTGAGSTATATGNLLVGYNGNGTLAIQAGGTVSANDIIVGDQASASGTVTVDGSGSSLTSSTDLIVGLFGPGHLTVSGGGHVTSANGYIGYATGFAGDVAVKDAGSIWTNTSGLFVGGTNTGAGTGALTISNGGTVNTDGLGVGYFTGSVGSLTIQGTNSALNDSASLYLGSGTISVSGGGRVSATDVEIASNAGFTGTLTVGGATSAITALSDFNVGYAGTGTAMISSGAVVSAANIAMAVSAGSAGTLTVDGTNSSVSTPGALIVGNMGSGTLAVQNDGTVNAAAILIGYQAGATGTVTVDGAGSALTSTTDLYVGAFGTGSLTVSNGASVFDAHGYIGYEPGSPMGTVLVTGTGSTWTSSASLIVGGSGTTAGTGALTIAAGGTVNTAGAVIAYFPGSVGSVTIQGANSIMANGGGLTVGNGGTGTLAISSGGTATSTFGAIGGFTSGTVTVDGAGSKWTDSDDLIIGSSGAGTLTLSNGGVTSVAGTVFLAQASGSNGTLNIGAASGSTAVGAGTLAAATIQFGAGTGTINFNHTDTAYVFSAAINGPGTINQMSGVTNLTSDSSGFTGGTNITGGRLAVNGSLANSAITVASGGILGGNGTVGGVTIVSGGIIAPGNSIGTLHVGGNVNFATGSIYQVEANAAGQADKIVATGSATLSGGTVQVLAATGSYATSTQYTILTASGGVTGTFAGVNSNFAFLTPSLSYDADDAFLTLTRNAVAFPNVGITRNQIASGSGIQSLGAGNAIYAAILPLDAATARAAFDQLSGEIHSSVKTGIIEDSRFVRDAAVNRLRAAFDTVAASSGPQTAEGHANPVPVVDGVAFWSQGFGSWGTTDSDGNAAKLDRTTSGFLIGADALTFSDLRVGLLGGYSHSSVDANTRSSSGSIDNFHLGAYGGGQWGALGLRSGAAYSWHHITTTRSVGFTGLSDRLSGAYDAGTAQVFGDIGYRIDAGPAAFEPFANLAYVNLRTNGFSESGTAAGLTGQGGTTSITYTTVGLRSAATFNLGSLSATTRSTLGWRHAGGDMTPATVLSFADGSAFSIEGVPVARDAAIIDAGVDVAVLRDLHISLSYAGQIAGHAQDHSVKANLDWRF